VAIGLWECQSGPSLQPCRNSIGGEVVLRSQSATSGLWKSTIKCTKSATRREDHGNQTVKRWNLRGVHSESRIACDVYQVGAPYWTRLRVRIHHMQLPGALPRFLKLWWVCCSPLAWLFAARILWEKTIWTWSRGPQMVGFALWHIHPGLAVVGTLAAAGIGLWLLIAIPFAIMRRQDIEPYDWFMIAASVFVITVLFVPDRFFASSA
jgi:hypothetical protein